MTLVASALATLLHEGVGHAVIAWLPSGDSDGLSHEDLEVLEIAEAFEHDDLEKATRRSMKLSKTTDDTCSTCMLR